MRAATTKIPHLLYEKDLLKNPEGDVWLYLQIMIYLQWICMVGMGEKPRNMYKRNARKHSPFGYPPIPPSTKREVVSPERAKIGEYV